MSSSALYPPIMDTYQKAVVLNGIYPKSIKIYCDVSNFNDVQYRRNPGLSGEGVINPYYTQVSIRYQNTNLSALNKKFETIDLSKEKNTGYIADKINCPGYNGDIKLCKLNKEEKDGRVYYYIELSEKDMDKHGFSNTGYYKIQIRFTDWSATTINTVEKAAKQDKKEYDDCQWNMVPNWLLKNKDCFSEWSKVSLLKAIAEPVISNTPIDNGQYESSTLEFFSKINFLTDTDNLFRQFQSESDQLNEYELILSKDNQIIEKSGIILADKYYNLNEIRYTFSTELKDKEIYNLSINYNTKNLYQNNTEDNTDFNKNFIINISQEKISNIFYITTSADEQRGSLKINLNLNSNTISLDELKGFYMFRRSSSRSNFEKWEDVLLLYVDEESNLINTYGTDWMNKEIDTELIPATMTTLESFAGYYWYDCTVESGIWYQYGIQKVSF